MVVKVWTRIVALLAIPVVAAAAQTAPPPVPVQVNAAPSEGAPVVPPAVPPPAQQTTQPVPPPAIQPETAPPLTVPAPPPVKKSVPSEPGQGAPPPAADQTASTYVIGLLDVISVQVWNSPNLSGVYAVRDDGMISMQLIHEVKVDGFTCDQLRDL